MESSSATAILRFASIYSFSKFLTHLLPSLSWGFARLKPVLEEQDNSDIGEPMGSPHWKCPGEKPCWRGWEWGSGARMCTAMRGVAAAVLCALGQPGDWSDEYEHVNAGQPLGRCNNHRTLIPFKLSGSKSVCISWESCYWKFWKQWNAVNAWKPTEVKVSLH